MLATIFFGQAIYNTVPFLEVGDRVKLKKENRNNVNHLAWFVNDVQYGMVSRSERYLLSGSETLTDEIYDILPEEFDAEIKEVGTVNMGIDRTAFIINIPLPGEEADVTEQNAKTLTFRVTGSNVMNPAKASVMKQITNNNIESVNIRLENNKFTVYCPSFLGAAGVINPERDNDPEAIKILKGMLLSKDSIEATTLSATTASYDIEVAVDSEALNALSKDELEQEKNRIIAEGICSMAELDEREYYALSVGISENLWHKILKTYRVYPDNVRFRIPSRPAKLFQDKSYIINDSAVFALKKKPLVFVGNKGTGKNCAVTTFAWLFNRPLYSMSINRDTDKMDLLGSKTIDATETENGNVIQKVVFQTEIILEGMEVGGFVLIDEVNCGDPGVIATLHAVMDDRRAIEVAGYRPVVADNNFNIIGTMNVDYQGTSKLNEALNDRMEHINFPDYTSIKHVLMEACPNANPKHIEVCDKIYQSIKKSIDSNEMSEECLTVRGFIDALEAAEDMPLKRALQRTVVDKVNDKALREEILDKVNVNLK